MSGDSHRIGPFVDFPSVLASFGIMIMSSSRLNIA
jgi:hypothetical protein